MPWQLSADWRRSLKQARALCDGARGGNEPDALDPTSGLWRRLGLLADHENREKDPYVLPVGVVFTFQG